jgi:hypothetical protein
MDEGAGGSGREQIFIADELRDGGVDGEVDVVFHAGDVLRSHFITRRRAYSLRFTPAKGDKGGLGTKNMRRLMDQAALPL